MWSYRDSSHYDLSRYYLIHGMGQIEARLSNLRTALEDKSPSPNAGTNPRAALSRDWKVQPGLSSSNAQTLGLESDSDLLRKRRIAGRRPPGKVPYEVGMSDVAVIITCVPTYLVPTLGSLDWD